MQIYYFLYLCLGQTIIQVMEIDKVLIYISTLENLRKVSSKIL